MEAVEYFGISFRSEAHLSWFQLSMGALAISCLWYGAVALMARRQIVSALPSEVLWRGLGRTHVFTSFTAILFVVLNASSGRPINGPVYSVDCIWFNALMAGGYYLLQRYAPKPSSENTARI